MKFDELQNGDAFKFVAPPARLAGSYVKLSKGVLRLNTCRMLEQGDMGYQTDVIKIGRLGVIADGVTTVF